MFRWIETFGMAKCKPEEFDLNGKEMSLDKILKYINFPETQNHKIKYDSTLELNRPASNSPQDISSFLKSVKENHYPLGRLNIKHEIYEGKIQKHYFDISLAYKTESFLSKDKDGKLLFSATVSFRKPID